MENCHVIVEECVCRCTLRSRIEMQSSTGIGNEVARVVEDTRQYRSYLSPLISLNYIGTCIANRLLAIVLLTALLTSMSGAAPVVAPSSSTTQRRWFYPCNGGAAAIVAPSVVAVGDVDPSELDMTPSELSDSFHTISTKATRLKRHVRDLKDLYVRQRFRDESIVEDLEQMGIRLTGMPEIIMPTINSVTNANMVETVHRAFEHLARVAVFVDQARIGETLASNEPISYERHFERLEDHNEHGLYWLLCSVQRLVRQTRRPIDGEVVDGVLGMRVVEVDRNSMRHTRDYLVLRDFERILERVSVEFAALGRSQLRRRHHQQRRAAENDDGSGSTTP